MFNHSVITLEGAKPLIGSLGKLQGRTPSLDGETRKASSSRARTALFGDNPQDHYSQPSEASDALSKPDRMRIRRFAKACTRNLVAWNDHLDRVGSGALPVLSGGGKGAMRVRGETLDKRANVKERLIRSLRDSSYSLAPKARLAGSTLRLHQSTRALSPFDMHALAATLPQDLLRSLHTAGNSAEVGEEAVEAISAPPYPASWPKRVVMLPGLPPLTGPRTVLAAVSGGALDRFTMVGTATAELSFLRPAHAEAFMAYGCSGMFLINGVNVQPQWKENEDAHQPVSAVVEHEMTLSGARRCLILKRQPKPPRLRSSAGAGGSGRYFSASNNALSSVGSRNSQAWEFSADEVLKDFTRYGTIVDLSPVISRKLCFALHFANVRSAIAAKSDLEGLGSAVAGKYSDWLVWYGKDPTDVAVNEI